MKIRSDWTFRPAWSVFTSREQFGGDGKLLSLSAANGVRERVEGEGRAASEDTSRYRVVEPGDVVINRLVARDGAIAVSTLHGIISPAYWVFKTPAYCDSRFLGYLLNSTHYLAEIGARSKFMPPAQFDLPWEQFRSLAVACPEIKVQRAIADYLDTETARIEALIAKKQRMIEVLEERWRAAVSELTAHGAPVAVRRLTSVRTSGPRGWSELVHDEGTAPFIRSANLRRDDVRIRVDNLAFVDPPETVEAQRSRTRAGDVLIGITGANTGWVGVVNEHEAGGYVSQHVAVLRPAGVDPSWLAFSLFSDRAQQTLLGSQYGGTKTQLGLEDLAEVVINVPDESQQRYITGRLDALRGVTEALRRSLGTQLELLREHRQALITAAVLGDLEVPGVAA